MPNAEGVKSGAARGAARQGPVTDRAVEALGQVVRIVTAAADQREGQGSWRGKGGGVQALAASLQALKAQ